MQLNQRRAQYCRLEIDEWRIKCSWCAHLDRANKDEWVQKDKLARYRKYVDYAPVCSKDGAWVDYNRYRNCELFEKRGTE